MPLLLSRLAPGCQTQPGPSGRRSEPSDGPAPLREAWGPRSLSSLHLNELGATDWQFFCSDTEQSRGDRDEAFEASRWKQDVWLAACMSLGRVWTPVCHPASLSWHQRFLSVDRQHFHTLRFQPESKSPVYRIFLNRQEFSYSHWNASPADLIMISTSDSS